MSTNKKNRLKKRYLLYIFIVIIVFLGVFTSKTYNEEPMQVHNNNILPQYNSKTKLDIVSCYGDNEAYHPKVLSFKEKWNGYKYWMAYTPYPAGHESKENPHIMVSNNLIDWKAPKGLINPLDDVNVIEEGTNTKKYNSDTHLIYNPDLDRIECYWRYVNNITGEIIIYRRCSNDGVNFSNKEIFIKSNNKKIHDYVSPAIIYENGTYKMWYVDKRKIYYKEKKKEQDWTDAVVVPVEYDDNSLTTWHLDVIATKNGFEMITVAYKDVKKRSSMSLYYSKSINETKDWETATEILKPTIGTDYWDNRGLYRACMIYENGVYIVFYSGISKNWDHGIGIVYGKDIKNLKSVNIDFFENKDTNTMLELIEKEKIK